MTVAARPATHRRVGRPGCRRSEDRPAGLWDGCSSLGGVDPNRSCYPLDAATLSRPDLIVIRYVRKRLLESATVIVFMLKDGTEIDGSGSRRRHSGDGKQTRAMLGGTESGLFRRRGDWSSS
jgi:hypothetical protein